MPFTTKVFAKGWLVISEPSPNGKLLVSARSMRDGKLGRGLLTKHPADLTCHGKALSLAARKRMEGRASESLRFSSHAGFFSA